MEFTWRAAGDAEEDEDSEKETQLRYAETFLRDDLQDVQRVSQHILLHTRDQHLPPLRDS